MQIKNYPFISLGDRDRPMLWISISDSDGTKRTAPLLAKIDTGCDGCIFPFDIAEELGYDLKSAEQVPIETTSIPTEAHRLDSMMIEVIGMSTDGSPDEKILCRIPKVPIYFVKDTKQLLLGTEGFLNHFALTVDYPNRVFSLVPPR